MGSGGYKIRHKDRIHFISFAVVGWIDVFTRPIYRDIFLDSLRHCQRERGLLLNSWCLMTNHAHLVGSAQQNDLDAILRDFKGFTSRQIIKAISNNEKESRKEWMLPLFRSAGEENSRNKEYQFWRQDNHPKECFSVEFTMQKINYIHKNPVVAGIVDRPEEYLHSSARDYHFGKKCGLIEVEMLLENLK